MVRPQLVFIFGGEFYHWSGGWQESETTLVLHWINKIARPLIEMHNIREIDLFQDVSKEWVEHTDFIGPRNQMLLGDFYHHAVLQTRVIVLDRDPKELHDANQAARHLADRHDLRFSFSRDPNLLAAYDQRTKYLTAHERMFKSYEALVLTNHRN